MFSLFRIYRWFFWKTYGNHHKRWRFSCWGSYFSLCTFISSAGLYSPKFYCKTKKNILISCFSHETISLISLTVILRGRAGYELIYITNEAVGRVGYYQLISGNSEKNNCFRKFSSNSLDFFGWNLRKSWHFLYRRRRENFFSDQHKKFAISFSLFGQT